MSEQKQEIIAQRLENDFVENHIYHLNKLFKITTNYHHRTFLNCFKWQVFQSLLKNKSDNMTKQRVQPQQWLYQSLVEKKKRTQQQMIEFQFINMCAQKIQNWFKAYIHAKRHRQGIKRLNKFKNIGAALLKGWKTRQIFRIVKMQENIKTIRIQKQQLSKECAITRQTNNKYSIRKLEYLKNSLQDQVRKFSSKFEYLYNTGEWVFQAKIPKRVQQSNASKWNKRQRNRYQQTQSENPMQIQQNNSKLLEQQQVSKVQQVVKKKRVRQMRDKNPRVSKPQEKRQKQQIQVNVANQYQNKVSQSKPFQSNFQIVQRPIKAKGVYQFDENQVQVSIQPIKAKKIQVLNENRQDNIQKNGQKSDNQLNSKRIAERQINKAKMQTRQKYDPRKAIQQQKRRKKQEQSAKVIPQPPQLQQKSISQKNLPIKKRNSSKSNDKCVIQSKSQKILKINQKQQISNRSTVNVGKGKAKVEAKIDCWGNRKTNRNITKGENNRMTYKMIHNSQQFQQKNEQVEKHYQIAKNLQLLNKIKEQKLREKNTAQKQGQINEFQAQNQQQKMPQKMVQYQKEQDFEAIQQEFIKQNKKLSTPLRQKVRRAEQMKQREAHKQIQELQKVYSQQYQSRFQKLWPKLHLLAAARLKESQGPIPVIMTNGNFMRRKIPENLANNRFWMIGKRIENSFKQFDKVI